MSHASLTARYRPQTFADVAGQSTLKAILSRAAAEDKVAPAYLFSGTRGVGKTTIARIFAKALNCRTAPAAEPCNDCDNCRAITLGSAVDVVEIDGASNRGIDDVRRLKESVGYAPMDGRYKIFIIDEAHMLSREAFNALLKTLEEPPARVTFIMATTEPHKFPVTIISRCQHYVFKRLSDPELEAHLKKVLGLENTRYEEAALRLLVRRAAGSVRDAMSLLGQVLALGAESLTEADTRMVLGLAGQELFFRLLAAVKSSDVTTLSVLVREMLDQGLDLGFFLRELSLMWRNLFMLRQAGEAAAPVVDLPEAEIRRWLEETQGLDLGHIHACWQMTLEGQRRVLTSLEPALALELLLLNLALLPRLLSMEQVSMLSRKLAPSQNQSLAAQDGAEKKSPLNKADEGVLPPGKQETPVPPAGEPNEITPPESNGKAPEAPAAPALDAVAPADDSQAAGAPQQNAAPARRQASPPEPPKPAKAPLAPATPDTPPHDDYPEVHGAPLSQAENMRGQKGDWEGFIDFCAIQQDIPADLVPALKKTRVSWDNDSLSITPPSPFVAERLGSASGTAQLKKLLGLFCGSAINIKVLPPPDRSVDRSKLQQELEENPVIQALQNKLGAELVDYGPWSQ